MGPNKKKAKTWEDIDDNVKDELLELREKEKMYKEKSGYNKWMKYFATGSLVYSLFYYKIYFKNQTTGQGIKLKSLFYLFAPICLYGFCLLKIFYDKEAFRNYYLTHIELNRVIKKTSQSSHYK